MRIAIIGSGISGLVVAHGLHRQHEITLFEANDYIGGHTNTLQVDFDGEQHAIDTGFIVFNRKTYPNFVRLLDQLGVASHPTSMSFSVRCESTGLEYCGSGLNGLFAQRQNLVNWRFYRLLSGIHRFNRRAAQLLDQLEDEMTVGEFVARERLPSELMQHYLLPMGSAVWSCPREAFKQFPIRFIAEFFHNHGLLRLRDRIQWRVVTGGSRRYVTAITRPWRDRIRLNCPVHRVIRFEDRVDLTFGNNQTQSFDRVVFACHSDQALRILGQDASPVEQELLGAFPYQRNVAILHTDPAVLPKKRRAWASWNYHLPNNSKSSATVTYNMNLLQGLSSRHVFCVTLNDEERIAPHRVIRRLIYHHPIFSTKRSAAQRRYPEVLCANRTSFCGAYWGNGFHEDGVVSALRVCGALQGQQDPREAGDRTHVHQFSLPVEDAP